MRCLAAVLAIAGAVATAPAQALQLHGLFGDHMVLPAATQVSLRGRSAPGAHIQVEAPWLTARVAAVAADDGRFALSLPTPAPGGPHRLRVRDDRGGQRELDDVLVGDVWLCSGQSNMEMSVGPTRWNRGAVDWQREVADADVPRLRLVTIARRPMQRAQDELEGSATWEVCTPANAPHWSAVAFFFGRELVRRRGDPLGLCVSCWGGTVAEAWTRRDGLAAFPEFAKELEELAVPRPSLAERTADFWAAVERADPRDGAGRAEVPAFDDSAWTATTEPDDWRRGPLREHDGVVWYRRQVDVPAAWAGQQLLLQLGPIDDLDTVWFDGRRVGGEERAGHWEEPRAYVVPAAAVHAGAATLAVRVVDTGGDGGFRGTAEAMRLSPRAGDGGGVSLAGPWRRHVGPALAELPPFPDDDLRPNRPSVLWNGMVAPLVPFPFRGVLWYQGEANRERAEQYSRLFPALIADWRAAFGKELPFLFAQIAPYGYERDVGELFELRRAQEAALRLPLVAMAPTVDIGEAADIHPRQKRVVGERLAALARRLVHGEDLPTEAPRALRAQVDGDAVRIDVGAAAGRLRTVDGGPHHFELAGTDGRFRAATAVIEGAGIQLRCDAVALPRTVRYAHAATAVGDVWNAAGLPLLPFELRIDP